MSWSVNSDGPIAKSAISGLVGQAQTQPEGCADAYRDQLAAAMQAALALAAVVGRDTDGVSVSLNGHANPDHAPHSGWADETVTIRVSAHAKGVSDVAQ